MELLHILSSRSCVSGEEMAKQLGISRAAIHKRVQKLRSLGYDITGGRNHGYTLISRPDVLSESEIGCFLHNSGVAGVRTVYLPAVDSTQTHAKDLANHGGPDQTLVVAEEQTGGYGRMGRAWFAPKGGVWFSLLLRPVIEPDNAPQLTLVMSLALCRVLEEMGAPAKLKWPNDVLVDGRKLCGILTEISAEIGRLNWVIIGVGMNVNNEIPDLLQSQAVALKSVLGKQVGRAELLSRVIAMFGKLSSELYTRGFAAFQDEYNERSACRGKNILINSGERIYEGTVGHIDNEGYLHLRLADGSTKKILAGDLTIE